MLQCQKRDGIANRILLALPQQSFDALAPLLELCRTAKGEVIHRADQPMEYMHFINRGIVSLVKTMRDGRTVEVGAVGIEGISSRHVLFGSGRAILDAVVQIPGSVFRIKREALRMQATEDPALRKTLEDYAHFTLVRLAQTAACNRLHSIEERCCRWLLMANDGALSDTFPLTHDFLARVLGVRRSGVSIAAHALQNAGFISYKHGVVTVMNRTRLEGAACECYRAMRDKLDEIVGRQARPEVASLQGAEPAASGASEMQVPHERHPGSPVPWKG